MRSYLKNIRFYILTFSIIFAVATYVWVKTTIQIETSQAVILDRIFALAAVFFLYLALLPTPLSKVFPNFPFRALYTKARRAIGVSAFIFAFLHSYFAFFQELGGFEGLGFLSGKYIFALSISAIALLILFLMAITSLDWAIEKLTFPKWKLLHRFVYLAGILTVIHALFLGSDFTDFSGYIPQIFFAALVILIGLEISRFDRYLQSKLPNWPNFGLSFSVFLLLIGGTAIILYGPSGSGTASPFNIHAAHIALAKQAQQGNGLNYSAAAANNPGLVGDRTRRFTVSFNNPQNVSPNQDTDLSFQVYDASSGNKVSLFNAIYTKVIHLIIVDSELKYFTHIHPTQKDNGFLITTQFPHPGRYHIYLDFQPLGAIEQQFAFTLDVGTVDQPVSAAQQPDTNSTKTFGKYSVKLAHPDPLKASDLSIGNQSLTFTISDSSSGQPITTLKPYLAAYGHLVMINEQTYDYLHVHPTNLVPPAPGQNGGPTVEFLPLGLYGPIKPGIYRVFAQFNPDNNLFTSDFTVKVE